MKFFTLLAAITLFVLGCSSGDVSETKDTELPELADASFDTPPNPLETPSPKYPEEARRVQAAGSAHIEVQVDDRGTVVETRVIQSSGHPLLDQAAVDAARQWTFAPAKKDDAPVSAKIVIPFEFKLE